MTPPVLSKSHTGFNIRPQNSLPQATEFSGRVYKKIYFISFHYFLIKTPRRGAGFERAGVTRRFDAGRWCTAGRRELSPRDAA
jgi:hypothetical protein